MGLYHAQKSPSGAFRWTVCTASIKAAHGFANTSNEHSRMGTCGHQLSAECLLDNLDPQTYLGRVMGFPAGANEDWADRFPVGVQFEFAHTVDQDLIDACKSYIDFVRDLRDKLGAELHVEISVPIGHITGEEGATGSSDAILVVPSQKLVIVVDLKLGRGPVYAYDIVAPESVDPITEEVIPPVRRMNLQAAMYGLGAIEYLGPFVEVERIKAIICQPFLGRTSEYECSIEELTDLGKWIGLQARECDENPTFRPSNKACHFCRAKFDCRARNAEVLSTALEGFDDAESFAAAKPLPLFLPHLGQLYGKVDMIRAWCDDIETAVLDKLTAGEPVVGPDGQPMKLVEGRKPAKAWADEQQVAALIDKWRLDKVMYERKLLTPSKAEKLAAGTKTKKKVDIENMPIGPRRWQQLSALVTQGNGKPVVALSTDPRPALVQTTTDMPEESGDDYDLF